MGAALVFLAAGMAALAGPVLAAVCFLGVNMMALIVLLPTVVLTLRALRSTPDPATLA